VRNAVLDNAQRSLALHGNKFKQHSQQQQQKQQQYYEQHWQRPQP